MLIGEYTHSIDDKNRVSLPMKFRKEVGKKLVATHGLDNCLFLYPLSEWKTISEKIGSLGIGQADFLREFAGLKDKVVFAGIHNRIEVWNEKRWTDYKKNVQKEADQLAEKLGSIGAL